jgi:hypothetical protein
MGKDIHQHVVVRADQALDRGEARRPAGRIERGMLQPEKVRDRLLQADGILRVAEQGGGAGAVHAVFVNHRLGGFLDLRMRG